MEAPVHDMVNRMGWSEEQLDQIHAQTHGSCSYCGVTLARAAYGKCGEKSPPGGAWEVDHWTPKSWYRGDAAADNPDNLWPACCSCNDEKSDKWTGGEYTIRRIFNGESINQRMLEYLEKVDSPSRPGGV